MEVLTLFAYLSLCCSRMTITKSRAVSVHPRRRRRREARCVCGWKANGSSNSSDLCSNDSKIMIEGGGGDGAVTSEGRSAAAQKQDEP